MNNYKKISLISLLLFASSICYAQEQDEAEQPVEHAKESSKKIKKVKKRSYKLNFRNIDTNEDREISLKEYIEFKKHSLEKQFDHLDKNQDGVIDRKEFSKMLKEERSRKKKLKR